MNDCSNIFKYFFFSTSNGVQIITASYCLSPTEITLTIDILIVEINIFEGHDFHTLIPYKTQNIIRLSSNFLCNHMPTKVNNSSTEEQKNTISTQKRLLIWKLLDLLLLQAFLLWCSHNSCYSNQCLLRGLWIGTLPQGKDEMTSGKWTEEGRKHCRCGKGKH